MNENKLENKGSIDKFMDKAIENMTGEGYLVLASDGDSLLDHDIEKCGQCYWDFWLAQIARDMIKEGKKGDLKKILDEHIERFHKKWNESKYVRLWVSEQKAGRDPNDAFKAFGWKA